MSVKFKINQATFKKLAEMPDKCVYEVARQTLDRIGASHTIPYNTGKMEGTMFQAGVKGSDGKYEIGNYTNYAKYVYAMNGVNWTNPASQPKWFEVYWRANGTSILENVIARNRL